MLDTASAHAAASTSGCYPQSYVRLSQTPFNNDNSYYKTTSRKNITTIGLLANRFGLGCFFTSAHNAASRGGAVSDGPVPCLVMCMI